MESCVSLNLSSGEAAPVTFGHGAVLLQQFDGVVVSSAQASVALDP